MKTKNNKLRDCPESWQKFLDLISDGKSVYLASQILGVCQETFYKLIDSSEEKKNDYTKARQTRGDRCLDRIEQFQMQLLTKEIDAPTARVLIDTEKWKACKFYPKMYGDRQELTLKAEKSFKEFLKEIDNNIVEE